MQCLGIDIGSTSIKGAVLDLEQRTLGSPVSVPFPMPVSGLPGGWIEIDPFAVCAGVKTVLSELITRAPDACRLLFSGQMGGLILMNDQAQPLTNYLSWRDQRTLIANESGRSLLDEIHAAWNQAELLESLGNELQPGSTLALLKWMQVHGTMSNEAIPTNIADFVIARLVGHPLPMHATHAIGCLDLNHDDWHRTALDCLGMASVRLPVLAREESCVGTTMIGDRRYELFGSYGDQQCALRGAGLQNQELSLNISTGSQVSRRVPVFQPGNYQSRKYFFGDYLDTVTHLPAGRSLNTLVELLTELARAEGITLENPWRTIQAKVMDVASTDLKVDLAFFRGPLGEQGSIREITTENLNVGQLFHASFRAMADNYYRIANRVGSVDWSGIVLSGGLTQTIPLLRRLIEERFPQPIRESIGEETLLGLLDIARTISTNHYGRHESTREA
ncbi:MAG: hypothetical protein DWH91_10635 [Planctomycetota bacterium]|nr:MAG: hypothetical protein DWH91_10635 [Planctomycetota bacterium]